MAKRNNELAWGPYRDWAEAQTPRAEDDGDNCHRHDKDNPGFWGPLFAVAQESLGTLPSAVIAQRSLRSFLEFVETMRSHSATVRFPKPPATNASAGKDRERWQPFRLSQGVEQGEVLLKKGRYQVLFHTGAPVSMLKLVELDDGRGARRGELLELGNLSKLAWEEDLAGRLGATLKAAGLEAIWDGGLRAYLSNQHRHLLRQHMAFEAVPEERRTEYRSFSAMPKALRRRLAKKPSDRVSEALRPQYLLHRKRLVELGLADKLNEMQAHDAALLACKQRAVAAEEQGLGKTRTCIAAAVLSGCRSILIVCYSRLVGVWQAEFEMLGLGDEVQLVENRSDVSSPRRFHIVSYERLAVSTERSTDLRCKVCHGPLSPGMRRCPTCHRRVWTQNGCPQCGANPDKVVTYCQNCGYCPSVYTPALYRAIRRRYSMAIFDESQAAKSRSAQRSRACAAIRTRRTLLATGTMLENYVYVQCPVMWRRASSTRWRAGS
ncbi:MAG: SNF2-related protein [Chloroflexi bacterium]|nr:SNF2-related protein [Chloroflexota bacterium]